MGLISFLFKRDRQKTLAKLNKTVAEINALEEKYHAMTDEELVGQTAVLKKRVADGASLDEVLPDAFAVVREGSLRVLNMRHFDVQLIGGIVLHQGRIAEMKTGEGKTLVATLPAYLNALSGKGVHIVTVNDYLAKRDAEWMGKVFRFLGMTVGCILPNMSFEEKKEAYSADVTYCTNNELGFDYLRDNMATNLNKVMQRGHNFAIVDEVDSILIDEARTPLIISAPAERSGEIYATVQRFTKTLRSDDYVLDEKDKHIYLSEQGVEKAERFFRLDNLGDAQNADLAGKINNALRANFVMARDQDYIVENGEVVIVDEFTGRKMAGRRYSEGLHQAIEAKENVRVKRENRTIATITFQNLFRMYNKLSGMTGTALTEEAEFKGIYNLDVVEIPTNREQIREDEADRIFAKKEAKYDAVIEEIIKVHETGQPVLVGTINVEVSELLSRKLVAKRVPHRVLNAKSNAEEASIIAQAGKVGAVTIATNMAGRGTDILLGGNPEYLAKEQMAKEGYAEELISVASAFNTLTVQEEISARKHYNSLVEKFKEETDKEKAEVKALGGLRVIGTERHESRRIDNQLRGRSGRQGDEGSSCFFLSFEDDLLRRFGGDRLQSILSTLSGGDDSMMLQVPAISKMIESAQKRCEEANYERRKYVLNYDDVMNEQRKVIYSERNKVLNGVDVHEQVIKYIEPLISEIVLQYVDFSGGDETTVDYDALNKALEQRVLHNGSGFVTKELVGHRNYQRIIDAVNDEAVRQYNEKLEYAEKNGIDFRTTERNVLLNTVDKFWMSHIDNMDILRKGIGLRGLGQRDPVIEYRREGADMFNEMIDNIQTNVALVLCNIDIDAVVERRNAFVAQVKQRNEHKAGIFSNDPCPCGSGKKYKDCCKNKR
ncbi:MAG: preprotein translocase subunit SecA [Christensenellales bacterium]